MSVPGTPRERLRARAGKVSRPGGPMDPRGRSASGAKFGRSLAVLRDPRDTSLADRGLCRAGLSTAAHASGSMRLDTPGSQIAYTGKPLCDLPLEVIWSEADRNTARLHNHGGRRRGVFICIACLANDSWYGCVSLFFQEASLPLHSGAGWPSAKRARFPPTLGCEASALPAHSRARFPPTPRSVRHCHTKRLGPCFPRRPDATTPPSEAKRAGRRGGGGHRVGATGQNRPGRLKKKTKLYDAPKRFPELARTVCKFDM